MSIEKIAKRFPKLKIADIKLVDQSLRTHGKLGPDFGDFSQGLQYYIDSHYVTIEDRGRLLHICISPNTKKGNWEFNADIDKTSGELLNQVIGTDAPLPLPGNQKNSENKVVIEGRFFLEVDTSTPTGESYLPIIDNGTEKFVVDYTGPGTQSFFAYSRQGMTYRLAGIISAPSAGYRRLKVDNYGVEVISKESSKK